MTDVRCKNRVPEDRRPYPSPEDPDVWILPLTKGYSTIIDAADAEVVSCRSWRARIYPSGHVYAETTIKNRCVFLSRFLLGPVVGRADHIDGNTLDDRRQNLRVLTPGQNRMNSRPDKDNKTGYKGVYKHPSVFRNKPYQAQIRHEGRLLHLGYFATPEEAAAAYNTAAQLLCGDIARLNEVPNV